MGIRQPGVKRKYRQFDRERHKESAVHQQLEWQSVILLGEFYQIEGYIIAIERHGQRCNQDKDRPDGGVKNEFGCRVQPLLTTPDGNQQIYRNQLKFPHKEEHQQVLGKEIPPPEHCT